MDSNQPSADVRLPSKDSPNESGFGQSQQNFNLRHYWHIILERRWLVIATFLGVFSLSILYIFKAPRVYRAAARIQIDREYDNVFGSEAGFVYDTRQEDYLQTQYRKLKGYNLIDTVRQELTLDSDERYRDKIDIIQAISDDIRVNPIRMSRLVDISVDHTNPETAKEIANSVVNNFVEDNLDFRVAKTYDTVTALETEALNLKATWDAAEQAVQAYIQREGMLSIEKSQDVLFQSLAQARSELTKAQTQQALAEASSNQVQAFLDGSGSASEVAGLPLIALDPVVAQLKTDIAATKAELDQALTRYKRLHPSVRQLDQRLSSFTQSLRDRYQELVASIQNEASLASKNVAELEKVVSGLEDDQMGLNQLRIQYDILKRDAEAEQMLYNTLMAKVKEMDVASQSESNNIRVETEAVTPFRAVKPNVPMVIVAGIVGGMAIGIGLAFFVNFLDDSIKSQDDVETYLRMPFLGYIPSIKSGLQVERDLQSHIHPQSSAAEGFRTLRTTISLMPNYDKLRVISVTSSIPSEGKSLISTNLAIVVAQTGAKTVLVDADLRRPALHKAFQLQTQIGLTTYLKGEVDEYNAITHRTEVPNLDIICCGAIPGSPSELAASARMGKLLAELRKKYDRIIVDCPPVSAVSDPLVVASRTDGVVMVTKFNKVRREHAKRTIRRLQEAGVNLLGVTLNDIDFEGKDSYYYSYYYYQNRYYATHYSAAAEEGANRAGRRAS